MLAAVRMHNVTDEGMFSQPEETRSGMEGRESDAFQKFETVLTRLTATKGGLGQDIVRFNYFQRSDPRGTS